MACTTTPPSAKFLAALSAIALGLLILLCIVRVDAASNILGKRDYSVINVTDFYNDWTAAHLVRDDKVELLFDYPAYRRTMAELWGGPLEPKEWSYPPHLLTLIAPLAYLPNHPVALLCWSVLGLLLYRYALLRGAPTLPIRWQALILLSPAAMVNLMHGQTGFFSAGFLMAGLYLLRRNPWLAGVCFGLLTLKPHLGLLLACVLLLLRQWRAILSALLTTATLIGASIAQWGIEPWRLYLTVTREHHLKFLENFYGFYTYMMPGIVPMERMLGIPLPLAWVGFALLAIPTALAVLWLIRREGLTPRSVLAFTLGTLLVTPYGFNYDMTAITIALGIYMYATPSVSTTERTLLSFLWLAPAAIYMLNLLHFPIVPITMLGLLAILVERARREPLPTA